MENTYTAQDNNENLLDDVDYSLVQASTGKRLANFFIDLAVVYAGIFVFIVIYAYLVIRPDGDGDAGAKASELQFLTIPVMVFLYFIIELLGKGKSLGKLMTGTRVVNQDGTRITAKTALLRSLSRMVPFEVFSAFGTPCFPWHDKWTDTYVIDERLSRVPQNS